MQIPWRYSFILIILINCTSVIQAQFNQTETFTFADGLAMTECSQVYCDRKGLLWIQHSSGWLSCFDGKAFTTYSPSQIGAQGDGTQFMEDKFGLWLLKNHSVSLFDSKKWKSWPIPTTAYFCLDKGADQVVLADQDYHLWKLDTLQQQWKIFADVPINPTGGQYKLMFSRLTNQYLLIHFDSSKIWTPYETYLTSSLLNPQWKEDPKYLYPGPEWAFQHVVTPMDKMMERSIPQTYTKPTVQLLTTSLNKLIYAQSIPDAESHKFIIKIYVSGEDQELKYVASFLNGQQNIGVAIDRMGNIWVASQSGLVRVYPNILQCFEEMKNMTPSLHVINEDEKGRIWFGGYTTGLCYFDNNSLYPAPVEAAQFKRFLPGHYTDQKGHMAFWSEDYYLITYHDGTWTDSKTQKGELPHEVGYYFHAIAGDQVAAGFQNYGLGITTLPLTAHSKWKYVGKDKGIQLDNVLTITKDSSGRLWLGRPSQGIAVYDPVSDTARTWLLEEGNPLEYGMISSVLDGKGRLWMGCTDGLQVMDDPGSFKIFHDTLAAKMHKVSMEEAGSSEVEFLTVYHQFLVFGNQAGYGFLDINSYDREPMSPRIFFFPTKKFGLSAEQNAVLVDAKNYLWIGEDLGASRIDIRHPYLDSLPVVLSVKEIVISNPNGDTSSYKFDELNQIKLPRGKRNVTVFIESNFTGWLNNNVGIQYRLVHKKAEEISWSPYTRHFNIRMDYLPPGRNILEVRAIKNNQVVNQTEFKIFVPFKLFETFLFWFFLFIVFSVAGFLFTRHVFRQRLQLKLTQINLAEKNREKNQFQISAIANALNPHFIKNTLAWIQSRFRKDAEVVEVIDRLAHNIASVFSHSRKGEVFHTLEEEFKLLENFLAIQIATYGPFMKVKLPQADEWSAWKTIQVPLLQFQIHAENAIEHGLRMKLKGEKRLLISFLNQQDYVQVVIEDNGIGRNASKERGSRGTHQGTMMLDRVYELYNQQNEYTFSTRYEDLYDEQTGLATGTRVKINIPKEYKTEIK